MNDRQKLQELYGYPEKNNNQYDQQIKEIMKPQREITNLCEVMRERMRKCDLLETRIEKIRQDLYKNLIIPQKQEFEKFEPEVLIKIYFENVNKFNN